MKGYAMLKIGESGWIEKERPKCGPMDAICRPLAVAICTSDVHTLWEGAIGDRHNMILGHERCFSRRLLRNFHDFLLIHRALHLMQHLSLNKSCR